ncbi:MAG TPA: ComF family protein [Gammaproteobacteria bacterium]|nr:ComF family protein [Gammaproteobacteria bacterium]
MLKKLEQWLFPFICCFCEGYTTRGQDLCSTCKIALPWSSDRCFKCGLYLTPGIDSIDCESCRELPPKFDRLCALFSYQPPITKLIMGLKFGKKLAYGRVMGELLADQVASQWYQNRELPEAVIPVPLHIDRLRKRGFNQALELLWPMHKQMQIPVVFDACVRIRKTTAQAQLDKLRRKRNLKSAFQIVKPISFEHIAIMDDVVTTGSTVNALTHVLKEAGVTTVDIWCICRA